MVRAEIYRCLVYMLTSHLLLIFAIVGSLSELQILPMCLPILPLFRAIKGHLQGARAKMGKYDVQL